MVQYILIQDKNKNIHKWNVYGESELSYKICAECDKRFITEVYKKNVYYDVVDEDFYCSEIKNPFPFIDEKYLKAEFREFKLKKGEY